MLSPSGALDARVMLSYTWSLSALATSRASSLADFVSRARSRNGRNTWDHVPSNTKLCRGEKSRHRHWWAFEAAFDFLTFGRHMVSGKGKLRLLQNHNQPVRSICARKGVFMRRFKNGLEYVYHSSSSQTCRMVRGADRFVADLRDRSRGKSGRGSNVRGRQGEQVAQKTRRFDALASLAADVALSCSAATEGNSGFISE